MHAIAIRDVTKRFKKNTIRREYSTIKSELVRWALRRRSADEYRWIEALKGVNLTVEKGSTYGLIGRNGSGKSTLLKLVTGIYTPTSGSISVDGRISALLELGAGFHPDFSGRENILINGIILGMSRKEIRDRVNEIIEFSELGDFIDEPVRTYSSGMFMRLAFSIATHVDPEILIIDEILAVGDEHFGRKSRAKMDEFREKGKTIFLVTHDLGTIERWCDRAAWLDGGVIRVEGAPSEVVRYYKSAVAEFEATLEQNGAKPLPKPVDLVQPQTPPAAVAGVRWGTFDQEIASVKVLGEDGQPQATFRADQPLCLELELLGKKPGISPLYTAVIIRSDGMALWETRVSAAELGLSLEPGQSATVRLALPRVGLADGDYRFDLSISLGGDFLDFHKALYPFEVRSGTEPMLGLVRLEHRWSGIAAEAPGDLNKAPTRPLAAVR